MNPKYIAVLGVLDPEMEAIETLLRECGVTVVYATVDGTRVHPGNTYRADVPSELSQQWDDIIAVECEWRDMPLDVVCADHHRHGDYGYGLPPSEFLRASSLGQVIMWLARVEKLPRHWSEAVEGGTPSVTSIQGSIAYRGAWTVTRGLASRGDWYGQVIPHDLVLTAAADHCLGAAYRGECPGVDPDELLARGFAGGGAS